MKRVVELDSQYGVASKLYNKHTHLKSNSSLKQSSSLQSINQLKTQHLLNSDYNLQINNVKAKLNKEKPQYLQQIFSRNPSSKTNIETNIVSEIQSLQYQSSQQPSFSSKGQFTVLEDFNGGNHGLVINSNDGKKNFKIKNQREDWRVDSSEIKVMNDLSLKQKYIKVFELLQELKLIKESLQSKINQQKSYFINELQEIKKLLFKLNIKCEKQMTSSRISIDLDKKQNQLLELRLYCKQIEEQKARASQKYSNTLRKYQQQIQIISQELSRRINTQRRQMLSSSFNSSCQKCMRLQQMLQNYANNYQQAQVWKNRCIELQERHKEQIISIQEQISKLKQQLSLLEESKIYAIRLKQRQRQILQQQSQCQYRLKEIQRRQRDIELTRLMMKRQRDDLEGNKQRIADYKESQVRRQQLIKYKNATTKQQYLPSEYFPNDNDKKSHPIQKRSKHYERSDSASSRGSRIDITARLKEIQMIKAKSRENYDNKVASRQSSKDSHYSGLQQYSSARVSSLNRKVGDCGNGLPASLSKEHQRQSGQSIQLSQKLNKLTETLQNQLKSII